jgi:hypothetical protein
MVLFFNFKGFLQDFPLLKIEKMADNLEDQHIVKCITSCVLYNYNTTFLLRLSRVSSNFASHFSFEIYSSLSFIFWVK